MHRFSIATVNIWLQAGQNLRGSRERVCKSGVVASCAIPAPNAGAQRRGIMTMDARAEYLTIITDALKAGEIVWRFADGSARYEAILDLEEAGILSAPRVLGDDLFNWRVNSRALELVSA
jgi:hypothetical protein